MEYASTRDPARRTRNFSDILLGGLADDGGLMMPVRYPQVSAEQLESWRKLSYVELATEIVGLFVTDSADDIRRDDLRRLIAMSYTPQAFGNGRDPSAAADITPLTTLEPGLHLLELSNGPTLAFKDIAMQLLGNLFEHALARSGESLNILGATSGDTGSAAEYAMRGKRGIRVFMLSPEGKMSPFQTAQMFSLQDPNIHNIAVCGVFDQCQDMVKAVSNDLDFKVRYRIGTVNSINWARLVAQVVYYFRGWLAATSKPGEEVSFAVPSGNFGNVCAGHVARMMGLPIRQLLVATNENDVLDEFFRTGVYRPRASAQTHATSSPSMDISRASNFERFVFDVVGRDPSTVASLWRRVEQGGTFSLMDTPHWANVAKFGFASGSSTHADRIRTIRHVHDRYGVLIDPHTADGVKVAIERRQRDVPMICLETALPAKFAAAIEEAVGGPPPRPRAYQHIETLPQRFTVMDPSVDAIKRFIVANAGSSGEAASGRDSRASAAA